MNRLFTQITQRTAMLLVALTAALSGNAVNVTYSLTTHIDGRTMTKTTSQDEGATLSLPYDMRRGYTTYTFYSDAALTTQIEVVPSEDATVYVDYEFNSPFTLSIDENHGVPLVIRGNNREGFVRLNASGELVKSADGVTNLEILGDAYCLYIYSPNERAYITWQSGSAKRTTSETKPAVGWQLLKNYNYSEHTTSFKDVHFALGTYDENSNNAKYLVKGDMDNITSSSDYQNNLSVTLNSSNFTQQTSLTISDETRKKKSTNNWSIKSNALNDGKTTLVSYIFSHTDHTYTITYYIVQDYEPYGITRLVYAPLTTAVIPSNPPEGAVKDALDNLKNNDLFDYSFNTLSMGEKQLIQIVCALGSNYKVLILDNALSTELSALSLEVLDTIASTSVYVVNTLKFSFFLSMLTAPSCIIFASSGSNNKPPSCKCGIF